MNEREDLQEFDLDDILNEFHEDPEEAFEALAQELPEEPLSEEPLTEAQGAVTGDTLVHQIPAKDLRQEAKEEDTLRLEKLSDMPPAPEAQEVVPEPKPRVIEIDPKLRLRELKKALIAGPEKRYYELDQDGVGRLQTGIFVNIVIGNEGDGMSQLVRKNCDVMVHIPMKGRISSLNASAAASILLYEAVRQRR